MLDVSSGVTAPLTLFPQIRTHDSSALTSAIEPFYGRVGMTLQSRGAKLDVIANHCELTKISLTYATHGADIEISIDDFPHYSQLFSYGGQGEAHVGRASATTVDAETSFVASASQAIRLRYAPDFRQFVIKLHKEPVEATFEAQTGERLRAPLRFTTQSDLSRPGPRWLFRSARLLAERLDSPASPMSRIAVLEFEDAILNAFVSSNTHNFSHLLTAAIKAPGDAQLRLVEEYIRARWDCPIYVDDLVALTGTSARSLFYYFRRSRGYSPINFAKRIRLEHAYAALSNPTGETSVTDISLACGFSNMGHFSSYYRRQFGEKPSATLRRAKGAQQLL